MLKYSKTKFLKVFTRVDRQENASILRYPDFGPLEIEDHEKFLESSKTFFNANWKKADKSVNSIESYEILQILGEGTFSEVVLAKHKQNGELYAIKINEKKKMVKNSRIHYTHNEMLVLKGLNSPFTVYLVSSFMDDACFYFVLPFIPGGELFTYLAKFKKFSEPQSRFYMAQIVLALEYLHHLDLVYRDLKPENVLIDHLGYLKLTDFGFCKRIKDRTYTLCGTEHYLAPEVVLGKGYGKAVDWWAVGVFTFELASGIPPFHNPLKKKLLENIVNCRYTMNVDFSEELKLLVKSLLQTDLTKRIGNLKNGVEDIKSHQWFRPIDWMSVLNRKVPADFVPPRVDAEEDNGSEDSTLQSNNSKNFTEDQYANVFVDF